MVSPAKPANGKRFAVVVVVGIDSGRAARLAGLANEKPMPNGARSDLLDFRTKMLPL